VELQFGIVETTGVAIRFGSSQHLQPQDRACESVCLTVRAKPGIRAVQPL